MYVVEFVKTIKRIKRWKTTSITQTVIVIATAIVTIIAAVKIVIYMQLFLLNIIVKFRSPLLRAFFIRFEYYSLFLKYS